MTDTTQETVVVLDYDALVRVNRAVNIKGVKYPFLDPEDYGIEVQAEFIKSRDLMNQMRANPSPENIEAYKKAQDEFVTTVVPGLKNNPVLPSLKEKFKTDLVETFFGFVAAVDYRTPEQKALETEETTGQ